MEGFYMNDSLPIWVMDPDRKDKAEVFAHILLDKARRPEKLPELLSIDEIKQRLKTMRQESRDHVEQLLIELQCNVRARYPQIKIKVAEDYEQAVTYIKAATPKINIVSANYSAAVMQDLKCGLQEAGFKVINSYLHEYNTEEKKFKDYWDLPRLTDKNLLGGFNVKAKYNIPTQFECKKYVAVLGVNAIAADDGTICFLQHFSNIEKDLKHASKIFLIAGIDKIVKTRDDACFQTQCMGIFGLENILLGIGPQDNEKSDAKALDVIDLPSADNYQELHLIVLDNGRREMIRGKYADLFLCIGCRACNKHCPIRHSFTDVDYIWTPKNYLTNFINGKGKSLDTCLHCMGCEMECPLGIDLPHLMWQAKKDSVKERGTTFSHEILGRPEVLAKIGALVAPLANQMMKSRPVRTVMEKITGIDRRTNLPMFHFDTFRSWYKGNGRGFDPK
jgi:L-lactate utilization protein LutB